MILYIIYIHYRKRRIASWPRPKEIFVDFWLKHRAGARDKTLWHKIPANEINFVISLFLLWDLVLTPGQLHIFSHSIVDLNEAHRNEVWKALKQVRKPFVKHFWWNSQLGCLVEVRCISFGEFWAAKKCWRVVALSKGAGVATYCVVSFSSRFS